VSGLRQAITALSFVPPGHRFPVPIHASIGTAVAPDDSTDANALLRLADERMYADKRHFYEHWSAPLRAELGETYPGFATLDAIVEAVDAKDHYTLRHAEDTLIHALQVGHQLGLNAEEMEWLQIAALLHDVGMIGVGLSVLRSTAPVGPAEITAIRRHPIDGARLVEAMPALALAAPAVRHHHERFDGGGYPDGLQGEDIPLLARILAVADAFSAMTTPRPYRKGLTVGEARAHLERGAGSQWDAHCVQAFLRGRPSA
jgi:HD-GYP domain-containing protein (c-di-GMP phosphodiesterase class II)